MYGMLFAYFVIHVCFFVFRWLIYIYMIAFTDKLSWFKDCDHQSPDSYHHLKFST